MNDYNLKKVLCQLNQWCATNNISVQSVYDECHGMTLQEIVYYLLGVVKEAVNQVVENTDAFKELYDFVHDYFDNLDLQSEVNNWFNNAESSGLLDELFSKHTLPVYNVTNYGIVGDGVTDNSEAFNNLLSIIPCGAIIYFPPCHDYKMKNISLKSNITITSALPGATISSWTHTDNGAYTDQLFNGTELSNIKFSNIIFSGEAITGGYIETDIESQVNSLLYLESCNKIYFYNCSFTKFISNVNPVTSNRHLTYNWSQCGMLNCHDIKFISCEQYETYNEGITCYTCDNILINEFKAYNSNTSSSLNIIACTNATILNSNISENLTGSSINYLCKGGKIDNCVISGGTSLDLGNESGIEFIGGNYTISNCTISPAINMITEEEHYVDNVVIENCTINNNGIASNSIRLVYATNFKIHNCNITSTSIGITLSSNCENITISNSTISAKGTISSNSNLQNLKIINNLLNSNENDSSSISSVKCIMMRGGGSAIICNNIINSVIGAFDDYGSTGANIVFDSNIVTISSHSNSRPIHSLGYAIISNCRFLTNGYLFITNGLISNNTIESYNDNDTSNTMIRLGSGTAYIINNNNNNTLHKIYAVTSTNSGTAYLYGNTPSNTNGVINNSNGTTAERIEKGNINDIYYNTANNTFYIYGNSWKTISTTE